MSDALKRFGVAVFGFGRAGQIHVGNLIVNPRAEILYIVEIGPGLDKAQNYVDKYQLKARIVDASDDNEVFSDSRVEAAIVAAPTYEHEKILRKAIQHNKAVFCEKPISQLEGGTKACYEEAEKANLPLLCSFNRRFDPSFRGLQQRVGSGEVGTVHVVKTCSRDSPLPSVEYLKISGGIFHDCAVHDIDVVMWMLKERPTVVSVMAHCHLPQIAALDDVDTVVISMKFASGALAVIDLSRHSVYGYDQRVEVFGTKGMIMSENQRPTEVVSHLNTGTSRDCIKYSFPQRFAEGYIGMMEHFFNVLEGKESLEVTKEDAINVTTVATACEQSYRTGNPIVVKYD